MQAVRYSKNCLPAQITISRVCLRTFAALIIVSVCFLGCRDEQRKQNEKLSVATLPWPGSTPLYVGVEKGYFIDEGVDVAVQPVSTGKIGLQAVLAGLVDVTGAADAPVANCAVNANPIAVIATLAEIQQAVVILARKDSGIAVAGDLKHKLIGITRGTGAAYFLHLYLVSNGILPDDVRLFNLDAENTVSTLLTGNVDAVSTWSPFKLMLAEQLGTNAVVLADPALYLQTFNLVTSQEFAKNNPIILQMFLRGLLRANEFIQSNPSEAQAIMKKYVGTDSVHFQSEWPYYHFTLRLGMGMLMTLEDQARWIIKHAAANSSPNMPNFLDFIDVDPLLAVNPEAVRITKK